MECSNANFAVTGSGRMISCRLCMGLYGLIRSGAGAGGSTKFLQCPKWRQINMKFYSVLKDSNYNFDKIRNEFKY